MTEYIYERPELLAKIMRNGWNVRIDWFKTWSNSDHVVGWRYRCSECMCFIPVNERDPETGDVISAASYCPNCGSKVVE